MQQLKSLLMAFVIVLLCMPPSWAERKTHSPKVNRREHHQKNRIRQGVKSGELSKEEAQTLKQEQKNIHSKEKEYKSDGTLSKEERKELHKELNEASQNIYEEKHDAEKH